MTDPLNFVKSKNSSKSLRTISASYRRRLLLCRARQMRSASPIASLTRRQNSQLCSGSARF